jgi:hypothetical protein
MKIHKSTWTIPLLALVSAGLSACSLLQRTSGSGYAYRGSNDYYESVGTTDYRTERAALVRDQAAGEIGYEDAAGLTEDQEQALANRIRLKNAERQITARREREQYFKNRPLIKNDMQRLEFLSQSTYESRERWLEQHGINVSNPNFSSEELSAIEANDVMLGMTKQAVRESWGEPELVEVAGNPIYGNERWKYMQEISSSEGYRTEARIIYFEGGRVAGWEKN